MDKYPDETIPYPQEAISGQRVWLCTCDVQKVKGQANLNDILKQLKIR